jgi:RNA polymerase sigma-70 factor (ECF subfamily)
VGGVDTGTGVPAFEDLYSQYAERVLNLAYRITGNAETARDLTQEIFLKVYENLGTFENRSHVFTWIYRVAVNHITNHLRREKRQRWVRIMDWTVGDAFQRTDENAFPEPREAGPAADGRLEEEERARIVWSAVQSLPVKYRVPLVLFHYEGMSHKEISDMMGVSVSAVETRIHRAKKQLVKKLEPWLGQV